MPEEEYSDASSSYWAPGWNFERWVRAGADDLASLPEGELVKMQDGLRDVLGDDGMDRLSRYMFNLEQEQQKQEDNKKRTHEGEVKRAATTTDSAATDDTPKNILSPPNWLRTWRKHFKGQPWGFVIFRAACYGGGDDDEDRWSRVKAEMQRVIELPFARAVAQAREEGAVLPDDFDEARAKFKLQWVEDVSTDNVATAATDADLLRVKYAALKPNLDPGLCRAVFLCASPEAVESFEKEASTTDETSSFWRPRAPFLLAVTTENDAGLEEGHEENVWFKPVFKVAAEALVESLVDVLDMGTPLQRITRNVMGASELGGATEQRQQQQLKEETERLDDIWWSMHPSPERLKKRRKKTELPQ